VLPALIVGLKAEFLSEVCENYSFSFLLIQVNRTRDNSPLTPKGHGGPKLRSTVLISFNFVLIQGNRTRKNPLTPELLNATRPDEIFYWGFFFLNRAFREYVLKTNKFTNYSFSLLIMYGSSYMFRHYIVETCRSYHT
jgi:hypothetical protein